MVSILYAELNMKFCYWGFGLQDVTYNATVLDIILEHIPMTAPNKHWNWFHFFFNFCRFGKSLKLTNSTILGIPSCSCGIFLWMLANNCLKDTDTILYRPSGVSWSRVWTSSNGRIRFLFMKDTIRSYNFLSNWTKRNMWLDWIEWPGAKLVFIIRDLRTK